MNYSNVTVIIPSLNPDEKLMPLINELYDNGFDDIVIVNDGSAPEYRRFFPDEEKYPFCTILNHRRNRGKGAALKTAFKYFREFREGKAGVVTIDADGQHLTNDIAACVRRMLDEDKVILGCRDFSRPDVPLRSRFGNKSTSLVFRLFCGLKISDTQTGLRAIPARYIDEFIGIKGTRYEYETNMLLEFKKRGIDFAEQTIDTVYIDDNKTSHFRPIRDSLRIYKLILAFAFSSVVSMVVDELGYFLLLLFVFKGRYDIALATIVARFISAAVNFTLNRQTVFNGKGNIIKSILKYIVLAICIATGSILCTSGLAALFGAKSAIVKTLIKIMVDTLLFFISFRVQQNWVFAPDKKYRRNRKDAEAAPKNREMRKLKQKLTPKKVVLRSLACLGTAILYLVVSVFTLVAVVAKGPSTTIRDALVLSAMQASATKWVPGLFLSKTQVQKIVDGSYVDSQLTIDMDSYGDGALGDGLAGQEEQLIDGMKYIAASYDNFKAYILLVKDPSRVYVGASSSNFASAVEGKRIFNIAKQEDCIAAINGGEFQDDGGKGTGAQPVGVTFSKGKCVWNDSSARTFMGFDKNNKLVVSEGMSKSKAEELGIRDGVCFQWGNLLIDSDENGVNLHYKQGNTGTAQRTAIGQRADGTVIFIVTDGRTASSLGATYNDIIDIMKSYGAVTAGMLDGGSSAMMYYENYFDKYDVDKSRLDEYQLKGLTNKYKAFTPPRRIPTYFCVSR